MVPIFDIIENSIKLKKKYENKHNNNNMKVDLLIREISMEKRKKINKKFSQPLNSQKLQQVNLVDLFLHFHRNSFFPTSMPLMDSVYQELETGFVFSRNENEELPKSLNIKSNCKKTYRWFNS